MLGIKKSTKNINDGLQHYQQSIDVFQRVANQFEFGKEYTEKEVNQRLREIYEDYALLRRYLVDYQYLERDKFGKIYQKCEQHTKII
ncbi:DUF2087 domain-containing protein [Enterococcus faecalis]|nr:DUF2087 domain-containing protein [Enterococcus faecalis]